MSSYHCINYVLKLWILSMAYKLGTIATPILCTLPKDHGNGLFIYQRWYYDNDTMTCQPFLFRGSAGNGNRFVSRENCSTTCNGRCYQPVPDSHNGTSHDPDCDGGGFEWHYHTDRAKCLPFRNSSCSNMTDTGNIFPTKHECKRDCIYHGNYIQTSCLSHTTREATCSSAFILSGKVSSIQHEIYSEYLVNRSKVVVDDVFKGRDLLNIHFVNQTSDNSNNTSGNSTNTSGNSSNTANDSHEIVSIRVIVSSGQDCHDVVEGSTYIFMGYIQYGNAIVDDTSYVKLDTPGRRLKVVHYLNRCP